MTVPAPSPGTLPRKVPPHVQLCFYANFITGIGLVFFIVGLGFAGFAYVGLKPSMMLRADHPRVTGTVTDATYRTSRKGEVNHRYEYRYQVNGKDYTGQSRSQDQLSDKEPGARPVPGQSNIARRIDMLKRGVDTNAVAVQYVPDNPALSRIVGMQTPGESDWWLLLFTLGFAPAGLFAIVVGIKESRADIRRMRHGIFANAVVWRTGPPPAAVGLHFKTSTGEKIEVYATGDGGHIGSLQNEEIKIVMYEPDRPKEALLLEALPKAIRPAMA